MTPIFSVVISPGVSITPLPCQKSTNVFIYVMPAAISHIHNKKKKSLTLDLVENMLFLKLDNRLLCVLSIFQLSAKSRIGKMFFSFWLFKQIVEKNNLFFHYFFFCFGLFGKMSKRMIHGLSLSEGGCRPIENYCSMLCMLHPCWHSHNRVTYHKRAAETSGILMLRAMKTFISRLWVSPPFWSYSGLWCVHSYMGN